MDQGDIMDKIAENEAKRAQALMALYSVSAQASFAEGVVYGAFVAGRLSMAMDTAQATAVPSA